MKKRLATIVSALALVAVMLVGLCACGSTYGSIKSAYEKAGYAESESVSDAQKEIVSTFLGEDAETAVTIHVLTKKDGGLLDALKTVVVIEFKSTEKMEELMKKHVTAEDAKNVYDELQKLDYVNGNCVLVSGDKDIFKGTK